MCGELGTGVRVSSSNGDDVDDYDERFNNKNPNEYLCMCLKVFFLFKIRKGKNDQFRCHSTLFLSYIHMGGM